MDALADRLGPLPRRLLIGLSGGADSVALTCMLLRRRESEGLALTAVHVNHGLRGAEADADEAFVRDFCDAHGLPLTVKRLDPPEHASEGWAREARYAAFREAYEAAGAEALVLAHHRDDQAETLLLHLLRGSGLTGLSGMARDGQLYGMRVIRPMLGIPRSSLLAALEAEGQPWREDATNAGGAYLRNRIRHRLIPLMEELAPGAASRLAVTAELLREDAAVLDALAEEECSRLTGWHCLPLPALRDLDTGLRRRVLRLWWQRETGCLPDAEVTFRLDALTEAPPGTREMLTGGVPAEAGRFWLHAAVPPEPFEPLPLAGSETAGPGSTLLRLTPSLGGPGGGRRSQEMPEALARSCVVRTRCPGDFIRPFGMTGTQSLQDYFVNRKVDAPFRDSVPLLCIGSEVLWAAGVGAGAVPRWRSEADNVRVIAEGRLIDCLAGPAGDAG